MSGLVIDAFVSNKCNSCKHFTCKRGNSFVCKLSKKKVMRSSPSCKKWEKGFVGFGG